MENECSSRFSPVFFFPFLLLYSVWLCLTLDTVIWLKVDLRTNWTRFVFVLPKVNSQATLLHYHLLSSSTQPLLQPEPYTDLRKTCFGPRQRRSVEVLQARRKLEGGRQPHQAADFDPTVS